MNTLDEARMDTLRCMELNGGTKVVDINDSMDAACALLVCLSLSKDGLCTTTKITDHACEFTLTDDGYAALDPTP